LATGEVEWVNQKEERTTILVILLKVKESGEWEDHDTSDPLEGKNNQEDGRTTILVILLKV